MDDQKSFDALLNEIAAFRKVAIAICEGYKITNDKLYACVDMERHIRELAEKLFIYRDEFNDFDRDDLF